MPRQSRIDAPGAIHHVIIRGIERRMIFQDNSDQEAFLDRLGKILTESSTSCYAWSLLGNHGHFLFRTGMFPISRLMRKLLTGYAVSFNRRHGRHGHLFQNRYKSILCEEEIYLKDLRESGQRVNSDERIPGGSEFVEHVLWTEHTSDRRYSR